MSKPSHARLSTKLLLAFAAMLVALVAGMIFPIRGQMRRQVIDDMRHELRAVAATAALQIDGGLHEEVAASGTADHPAFVALRDQLRAVADVNGFGPDNLYTFYEDRAAGVLRFGVMIHDEPFVGDPYDVQQHQAMAAQSGTAYTSELFADKYGHWIAASAPIRGDGGAVVGLLEVARTADELFARVDRVILTTTVAALLGLVLASAVGFVLLRRLVIVPVEKIHKGMLALAQQDFAHRTVVTSGDEFEALADTLNHMANQLNVARSIQEGFVPQRPPSSPGYVFAYRSDPCDATGGDYIDAFDLPDGHTAILVADVTGHGLGPSLIMASCRSALRALAQTGLPPGPLLDKLESQIAEDLCDGRFITMIFAVLGPDGEFTYANAGHAPALVIRGDKSIRLASHRPPLGIFLDDDERGRPPLDDQQTTLQLEPGDRVLLTSDGVNEAQDAGDRLFGIEPVEATACRRDLDPAGVIERLDQQITLHRAGRPAVDDVTMLCVDRVCIESVS